ncbi:MAG: RNA polymerase sigma factor [Betaproteobacteria bacterium]|nr:RNA polymerase sigma factor [Betaproteobacteria bacterium]MDE2004430.1 RNA polymerase sigma factor [Betaproteobacteria bacterium]MDE2209215.1 RNA polymerase sigma factor [Betaproteobacteria bacterium]
MATPDPRPPLEASTESESSPTVGPGSHAAFEALMRRHNRRLFRTARAILRDDATAEDALQDAYVAAFRAFEGFRGEAQLSTWLTRIVVNQSLQMLRKSGRERVVVPIDRVDDGSPDPIDAIADESPQGTPEDAMLRSELRRLIERRIDDLPAGFRTVFVLREVEEMTVEETARCLDLPEATVRTRLFRAKARLREALASELDVAAQGVFAFDGDRCDRIVAAVLRRIAPGPDPGG